MKLFLIRALLLQVFAGHAFAFAQSPISLTGTITGSAIAAPEQDITGQPSGTHDSNRYEVTLGGTEPSAVYMNTNGTGISANGVSTHWTQAEVGIEVAGFPVAAEIELLSGVGNPATITSVTIRPSPLGVGISATHDGVNTINFDIPDYGYYFIDVNAGALNATPLLIFISPPDPFVLGTCNGGSVTCFAAGDHDLDDNDGIVDKVSVPYGRTYHFALGAWVGGLFNVTCTGTGNTRFLGHGVISGEQYTYNGSVSNKLLEAASCGGSAGSIIVDGPTFSDPPTHIAVIYDSGATVNDTKFLGYNPTSDGLRVGASSTVSDNFFKTNDDQIKIYANSIVVTNNVHWMMQSGCLYQLSWNNASTTTSSSVDTFYMVGNNRTTGTYNQTINNGVFCSRNFNGNPTTGMEMTGLTFTNGYIEVAPWMLFNFWLAWDISGFTTGRGGLRALVFTNISSPTPLQPSYFNANGTLDGRIRDFDFNDVEVNGTDLVVGTVGNFANGDDSGTFTFSP